MRHWGPVHRKGHFDPCWPSSLITPMDEVGHLHEEGSTGNYRSSRLKKISTFLYFLLRLWSVIHFNCNIHCKVITNIYIIIIYFSPGLRLQQWAVGQGWSLGGKFQAKTLNVTFHFLQVQPALIFSPSSTQHLSLEQHLPLSGYSFCLDLPRSRNY